MERSIEELMSELFGKLHGSQGLRSLKSFFISTSIGEDLEVQVMMHWDDKEAMMAVDVAQHLGMYIIDAAARAAYDGQLVRRFVDKGMSPLDAAEMVRDMTSAVRADVFTEEGEPQDGEDDQS